MGVMFSGYMNEMEEDSEEFFVSLLNTLLETVKTSPVEQMTFPISSDNCTDNVSFLDYIS